MPYNFESTSHKISGSDVIKETFLQDLENQKFLLVAQNLNLGTTELKETNWKKEPITKNTIRYKEGETKGRSIKELAANAGFDAKEIKNPAILVSHTPPFHADDLMAVALMIKYFNSKNQPTEIVLTRDQKVIDQAHAAVDVGGAYSEKTLRFDHHQLKTSDKAATGLVANFLQKEAGFSWISKLKPTLEKIDKADLGNTEIPEELTLSEGISNFNTTWKEKAQDPKMQFFKALCIVEESLDQAIATLEIQPYKNLSEEFEKNLLENKTVGERRIEVQAHMTEGEKLFIKAAEMGKKDGIAHTTQGIDFYRLLSKDHLSSTPKQEASALKAINYITFESTSGCFNAIAAPKAENKMEQKHPFPQSWRGKRGQELLDEISKSTGGKFPPVPQEKANEYFCHNAGFFLAIPESKTFSSAVNYCAALAKERDKPQKDKEPTTHKDLWGRGGPI